VPQCPNRVASDVEFANAEKFDIRQVAIDHGPHQIQRRWALQLKAENVAAWTRNDHVVVSRDFNRQICVLSIELQPVAGRRWTDNTEEVVRLPEDDRIRNKVPTGIHHDQLLGPHGRQVAQVICRELGDKLDSISATDVQLGHVVRLLKQHNAMVPSSLLIPPIGKLRGNTREDYSAVVGRSEHGQSATGGLNFVF